MVDEASAADRAALARVPSIEQIAAPDIAEIDSVERQHLDYIDGLIAKAEATDDSAAVALLQATKTELINNAAIARSNVRERARAAHLEAVAAAERSLTPEQIASALRLEALFGGLRAPYEQLAASLGAAATVCPTGTRLLSREADEFLAAYDAWVLNVVAACVGLDQVFSLLGRACPLRDMDLAAL